MPNRDSVYVRAGDRAARLSIVEMLEGDGFVPAHPPREEILDSKLPLIVDRAERTYSMAGNVTCAAAAVTCGRVLTPEGFTAWYRSASRHGIGALYALTTPGRWGRIKTISNVSEG